MLFVSVRAIRYITLILYGLFMATCRSSDQWDEDDYVDPRWIYNPSVINSKLTKRRGNGGPNPFYNHEILGIGKPSIENELYFYGGPDSSCFNTADSPMETPKAEDKNIKCVTLTAGSDWIFTPHTYGLMTKEKFAQTLQKGDIPHTYGETGNTQVKGLPESFLKELLALESTYNNANKPIVVIITTGMKGMRMATEALKTELEKQKNEKGIKDYIIAKTDINAIEQHNQYIQQGCAVYTLLHFCAS